MKKLPLILIGLGVLIVVVVATFILKMKSGSASPTREPQASVPTLPQSQWPLMMLMPTSDPKVANSLGHFIDFQVQNIHVPEASSMDYLLVYNTSDGGQQGVPGTVQLSGGTIERKLLLGSESSGHFRFDDGVSQGTMTITFRDASGKTLGKLSSDFSLQTSTTTLTSVDGKFTYTLDSAAKGVFFITMPTFTQPPAGVGVIWQNGYGVFSSDGKPHSGKVSQ